MHGENSKSDFDFRLMRRQEVERMTGLSTSSIYAGIKAGTFPVPLKIGRNAVAWISAEVEQWIAQRIDDRNQSGGRRRPERFKGIDHLPEGTRLLRRHEVEKRTGKSRAAIYADMKSGDFPTPVRLSDNAVAWLESEVNAFLAESLAERNRQLEAGGTQ